MDVNNRITQMEDEIKVLKNEVLAVLLDIKENMLETENPFSRPSAFEMPAVNITQSIPSAPPLSQHQDISNGNGNGHNRHEYSNNKPNEIPEKEQQPAPVNPPVMETEPETVNNRKISADKPAGDIPSPNGFITEDTDLTPLNESSLNVRL
ncbi:MAG: hypothetical protein P3T54_07715 [Dehalogenimonas sp.]|uniref:Uncharacterized protein n=1 Tax=Candidatus Dehalogenimonas loeffleri TaxID=3127115 RepID=A0ABZ2J3P2_9CHLR|nr:hypothetical protein [Dehalogenimonas sp.]